MGREIFKAWESNIWVAGDICLSVLSVVRKDFSNPHWDTIFLQFLNYLDYIKNLDVFSWDVKNPNSCISTTPSGSLSCVKFSRQKSWSFVLLGVHMCLVFLSMSKVAGVLCLCQNHRAMLRMNSSSGCCEWTPRIHHSAYLHLTSLGILILRLRVDSLSRCWLANERHIHISIGSHWLVQLDHILLLII